MPGAWDREEVGSCCSVGAEFQSCKIKSSRDGLYNSVLIVNSAVYFSI